MHHLSAVAVRDLFIKGELSADAILQFYLARINKYDPQVQAFLSLFSERALEMARNLDKKRASNKPLGKLAGIPIAIKDNIHLQGEVTTCGSLFLKDYRAPFSATVVSLIEKEDGIIIGKTNLDEFAMGSSTENSAYHPTKNPWNLSCSPGGSSGGSAAAVSARFCPLALGSDTGGSVRQPAALTGVIGFKPTYGHVSRYGLVAYASSLDQIGPLGTTTQDIATLMEVIGSHCPHDSTSFNIPSIPYVEKLAQELKGKKIGVPWRFLENLEQETKDNFMQSLELFQSLGVSIIDVDLDILKYSIAVYYIIATAEASTNLARFDGIRYGKRSLKAATLDEIYDFSKEEGFGKEVKNRILLGTYVLSSGYKDAYHKKAQKVRTLIIQKYKEAFKQCDILAMPTSPFTAFPIGSIQDSLQMYLQDVYTISANLAGIPAASIPSGFSKENKPFGLQLLGPYLQDSIVLSFAHEFEKMTTFHKIVPKLFDDEPIR